MVLLGSRVRSALAAMATMATITAAACSKPLPPELTPKQAKVTSVDLSGFDMRLAMDAFNPNGFDLSIRSVVAHVTVDGNQDLGTVTASQPIRLPAKARATVEVPLNVKWQHVGRLASIAAAGRPLPYAVDGTATIGGERLNVEVPFKLQGVIPAEQIQQATLRSLQGIPGLQGLPGLSAPR